MNMGTLWTASKQAMQEVRTDDVVGLSAELAYRFFLAIFPFFIFLAALGGIIAGWLNIRNPAQRIVDLIGDRLPSDAASMLETQLRGVIESQSPGLLSFGIIAAIWTASSGFKAVMKAMNRAYDVEETRSFLKKYLVGVGLTVLAGGFAIGAFALVVVGQFLAGRAADAVGLGGAWQTVITYGRWPAALALVVAATAFLYWAAPNLGLPFKWITPGAVLFTVVWLIATVLFGFYVANFGSYNATYGALGGVVVLLLWFYITAFILLVGAEVNAIIDERADPAAVQAKREEKRAEAERKTPGSAGAGRRAAPPPISSAAPRPAGAASMTVVAGEARRFGSRLVIESETKATPVAPAENARITRDGKLTSIEAVQAGDWVMASLNENGMAQMLDASGQVTVKAAGHGAGSGYAWVRVVGAVAAVIVAGMRRLRDRGDRPARAQGGHRQRRDGRPTILRRAPSR